MSDDYRIGRLRGKFQLVIWRDGKRKRYTLGTSDPRLAAQRAPGLYAEITRPKGTTCDELWRAYCEDKKGRAVVQTMEHTWKALKDNFGGRPGDTITIAACRDHIARRQSMGILDGTIHTELGHLRMVLLWAEKNRLIERAPYIERPPKPKPKEIYLTRSQARSLRECTSVSHVRIFIILAQATGARNAALLELTWDRIDFESGLIDLRNPNLKHPHKGRAIVPMNRELRAALLEAKNGALSDHVIEWAGRPVKSVKRGLKEAARKAGLSDVSPHVLRHSAACHLAEAGVPMTEIASFLGHSDSRLTERVYAKFSSDYLRKAAEALEYDDLATIKARKG